MLTGLSDAQMRWAYAHATVLVAPSHEDFGLTPLEAAAFGVPTVALHAGGYLDTIVDGETGLYFAAPTAPEIAAALVRADAQPWNRTTLLARAEEFSEARFSARLHRAVEEVSR